VVEANRQEDIDPHAYLQEVKAGGSFAQDLRTDLSKYVLPKT